MDALHPAAEPLSAEARRTLVALAHGAVEAAARARGSEPHAPEPVALPDLVRPAGCFVTLYVDGQLKGCLGTFDASRPLLRGVVEMARAAATRDPRFSPVEPSDLPRLKLSISVLSPLRPIADVGEIEIGRHGLEISRGHRRGVLLPQVAVEHGMDRDAFLAETCLKAGLASDAWKEPETRIRVFEAEVFGDGPP